MREVRRAVDTPVGIAGSKGKFGAVVLAADIPASLRRGASEVLRGLLDFTRDILTLRKHGADIPPASEPDGTVYLERGRFS